MDAEKIRISLAEDTYAYVARTSNEENAETFKIKIQKYISILKEVVESDFDILTDKELYELLSKIYDISLDDKDYLKMLSIYNDKKYRFICRIYTTMTFKDRATEGHGRSFDWWEQLYQVYYLAAISDKFEFDYNKTYSKEEIKKLLADKSIVLLKRKAEAINGNIDFIKEEYESIPMINIDIEGYSDNMSQFVLNNFNLFGGLLRKKFTKKKVLNDIKELISDLGKDIDIVFSSISSHDIFYSETAEICKKWYELSEEKIEYQKICKLIRKMQKNK